ncbi:MAG: tetratricopeptide repeat protein [Bacteroidetes bacterium]|nr:tetratricopeptide repeat protein [Bacteroidota bacterium]
MKRVLHGASYVLAASLFAASVFLTGCGTSVETSKAADSLNVANQQLTADNSKLRKNVDQLEQDKKALNAKVADLTSKLGQSSQQWQDLQDLQARVNQLDSELTVQKKINRDLSAGSADMERESLGSGLAPVTTRAQFKTSYNEGLNLFRSRSYLKALAVFGNLSESTAAPELTGNAFYWMGECYYGLQKYADAVNAFAKVLTFRGSYKTGAAYIMLGMSYLHMGNKEKARTTWEELLQKDPKSQYASRAKEFLNQL